MIWWMFLIDIGIAILAGVIIGIVVVWLDARKIFVELLKSRRAIEYAEYLATAAEAYMDEMNALDVLEGNDQTDAVADAFRSLRSRIYEFRKRAAKVKDNG